MEDTEWSKKEKKNLRDVFYVSQEKNMIVVSNILFLSVLKHVYGMLLFFNCPIMVRKWFLMMAHFETVDDR